MRGTDCKIYEEKGVKYIEGGGYRIKYDLFIKIANYKASDTKKKMILDNKKQRAINCSQCT